MLVQHILPLGDARCPRGMITRLGRAGKTGAVTCAAGLLENCRPVLWYSGCAAGRSGGRIRLDRKLRIVLPGDRFMRERLNASGDALQVLCLDQHLLLLRVTCDIAR